MQNSTTNDNFNPNSKEHAKSEPKYITAQNGVQLNPAASPKKEETYIIEPPKVPTQHF